MTVHIEDEQSIRDVLNRMSGELTSLRRHIVFLEEKQDKHEEKTSELLALYRGAGIIGKIMAWIVGLSGSIGTIIILLRNKGD